MTKSIFRAYDIRGVFGEDLTVELAENIGKAFGTYAGGIGKNLSIGWDARLSARELKEALVRGLTSVGCNVTEIGLVPTPLLYFSIYHYEMDGGVMITGSHNPPEYNGFKLLKEKHTLFGDEIQEIRKIVEKGEFFGSDAEGKIETKDIIEDYISFVKKRVFLKKKLKIVIDAGNGAGGFVSQKLFEGLFCDVVGLNMEPDGNFPNHSPDPTVDENLTDIIEKVKKTGADLGIAYDGDADRLGVVDNEGNIIRGDQILTLFSREVLKKHPGSKIIFEVKCSQALIDDIKKNGGIPIMYRTGHSFIKKKMKEENALLAGEMSGHFFIADNYYGYDDGIFASLKMVEFLSKNEKKLSEIVEEDMPRYFSTPEIRVKSTDDLKFGIVEKIKKSFQEKGYNVITVDGVRVQFKNNDGWGLVRASNTEPSIILRFEAKTLEKLEEIKKLFQKELKKFDITFFFVCV